jgi:hypothetical protein
MHRARVDLYHEIAVGKNAGPGTVCRATPLRRATSMKVAPSNTSHTAL